MTRPWNPLPDRDGCLFYTGAANGSSGQYDTFGYHLRLGGTDLADHHLTHLHEIHHKALNDDTAWGIALHITARHPLWSSMLYPTLLATCRSIHEAYATFMSVQLAAGRHRDVETLLDQNPVYRAYYRRLQRLLAPIETGHRRDLAATGIARFCMSGPILELLAEQPNPTLALLRSHHRPDTRFAMWQQLTPETVAQAARVADGEFTPHSLDIERLGLSETDHTLDTAWARWEDAFVRAAVTGHRGLAELEIVDHVHHLRAGRALIDAVNAEQQMVSMHLASPTEDAITDVQSAERLLAFARIPVADRTLHTREVDLGDQIDVDTLVAMVDAEGRGHGLVIHGRPRVPPCYGTPTDNAAPVFTVRVVVDENASARTVLHARVRDPDGYRSLLQQWADRGPITHCLTASCFTDTGWQRTWMPHLRVNPTVLLLDTAVRALSGSGRLLGDREPVWARTIDVGHPHLRGLVLHHEGHPHVITALGDDLTVELISGLLSEVLGERFHLNNSDWTPWAVPLAAVMSAVLTTEAVIRFDVLEAP